MPVRSPFTRPLPLALFLLAGAAGSASAQCAPSFITWASIPMGNTVYAVEAGDIDGDGHLDLITDDGTAQQAVWVQGPNFNGAVRTMPLTFSPMGMAFGDFNGDGRPDVTISGGTSARGVATLWVNGTITSTTISAGPCRQVAAGDLDGDGRLDQVVTLGSAGTVLFQRGNGGGGFSTSASLQTGTTPNGVALIDVDRDGRLDIVVSRGGNAGIMVIRNLGGGAFAPAVNTGAGSGAYLAVADFNNDGIQDIACANQALETVSVRLGDGVGSFGPGLTLPVPGIGTAWQITAADLNNDGAVDLVVPCKDTNTLRMFMGDGHGGFGPAVVLPSGGVGPSAVLARDLDGDGKPELVIAHDQTMVKVYRNTTVGTPQITGQPQPAQAELGGTAGFTVEAGATGFQWMRNGVPLAEGSHFTGVTTAHLTISAVTTFETGTYSCTVSGCFGGTATSDGAALTMSEPCSTDFNHDGFVDFFDYDDFVAAFEGGC